MAYEKSTITLTPKLSFTLGLVGGVLVICSVGFFILLSMMMGDGGSSNKGAGLVAAPSAAPNVAAPAPSAPPAAGEVKPIGPEDHVRGDKNAAVTVFEYSDYECPFCSRFHPTMVQVMEEYDGEVNWVYRHFPLSFHPEAGPSANAAECAGEQDAFWEYTDELFANQTLLSNSYYKSLASDLGLNSSTFDDCLDSNKYQAKVADDQTSGATAGVTGTPGSLIVGADGSAQLVPGAVPYAQLKAMIDAAL